METYYRDYQIVSEEIKEERFITWSIYKDGIHILSDSRTIEGGKLQSVSHAINDAKSNIDTFIRLNLV